MSQYRIRPLRLKDARLIREREILGHFPSIRACRDELRLRLEQVSAHEEGAGHTWQNELIYADPADQPLLSLSERSGTARSLLRQLSLFQPNPERFQLTQEAREAFPRLLRDYLREQRDDCASYLIMGDCAILRDAPDFPLSELGTIPLALEDPEGSGLRDLPIHVLDLSDVDPWSYAFYPTAFALFVLRSDALKLCECQILQPGESPESLSVRRLGMALGALDATGCYRVESQAQGPRLSPGAPPVLEQAVREMEEYFRGERLEFDIPLEASGTEFQRAVWREIARIPYGAERSYLEISRALSEDDAEARHRARAVGGACGANPIALFIPCHRVLASSGKLHGFSGGLKAKAALLDHEMMGRLEHYA